MTYKCVEVRFHNPQTLFDLTLPIAVFKEATEALDDVIVGCNFNKYCEDPRDPRPRLSIRLNVCADEKTVASVLNRVLQKIQREERILDYDRNLKDWNEPDFVIAAHEAASECAVIFSEELTAKPALRSRFLDKKADFMGHFTKTMLRRAGFTPYISWTFLRSKPPEGIEELAESCVPPLSRTICDVKMNPDFLERFVHCFFNCTTDLDTERTVMNWYLSSVLWTQLAASATGEFWD